MVLSLGTEFRPMLLRKLNHKYESFVQRLWIFPVFPTISTHKCVSENLPSPLCRIQNQSTVCIVNVILHLRSQICYKHFCTIKGIKYDNCAYKSEINHWYPASSFISNHILNINILLNLIVNIYIWFHKWKEVSKFLWLSL